MAQFVEEDFLTMAQFVEEGQTEGNETAQSKPAQTLEQWLKKNRLKKLAAFFEDEEVVLDDLKTYSEAVIELSRYLLRRCIQL